MARTTHHLDRKRRQEQALERQQERAKRDPAAQTKALDTRPGNSTKERQRLTHLLMVRKDALVG